jgi:hypothetical protein
MTFWMGMVITASVATLREYVAGSGSHSSLAVLLMPLFGIVLVTVGYYPERRKAIRLLTDAFRPK